MANYEFGIGINVDPASVNDATKAIGGVISNVDGLKNSMSSLAGVGLDQIFKGFDPSLLMPNNDALEEMRQTLHDIGGIMVEVSGDTERMAKAIVGGGSTKALEEVDTTLQEVAQDMCGVTTCVEEVDTGLQEVAKSTKSWAMALQPVAALTESAGQQAGRIQKASDLLLGSASQLEFQSVKTEAAVGKGRDAVNDFGTSALRTANRMKVSWQAAAGLQTALRNVAVEFDTSTKSGRKQMDTMVLLGESFGMSKEQVADLAGTMKATGNNLGDLAADAIVFQKKFKVPGLINQLPAAAKGAMEAQMNFGSLVNKSSREITNSVLRMAGQYSRALGTTAADAAQKAMSNFQKFAGQIESYEDLFLGLSDDFSPLQTALLETGMSMEDMQDLLRKGQDDPAAFADSIKGMMAAMDPQMAERLRRQVMRNSSDMVKAYLTQDAAAENARQANEEAAKVEVKDPGAVFMEIAGAMRESAVDAVTQQEALKGVTTEMAKFAASEGIRKGIQNVNKAIQSTNTVLLDQWDKLRNNKAAMSAFSGTIEATTTAMNGLNVALGAFNKITSVGGTLVAGVAAGVGLLWKPVKMLFKVIGKGGGQASKLGKVFKALRGPIGKIALPIGIAIAAFEGVVDAVKNVGKVLSDPNKSGMDKVKGVFGAILGGVGTAINSFFLGLPGKFIEGFRNVGGKVNTEGSESMGKAIGNVVAKMGKAIVEFFGALVTTHIPEGWAKVKGWWTELDIYNDIGLPLISGMAAIGDQILAFFKGVGVGMLEAFGMSSKEAGEVIDALGTFIKVAFEDAFANVWYILGNVKDYFVLWVVSPIEKGISYIKQGVKLGMEFVRSAFSVGFAAIETAVMQVLSSIVSGVTNFADGVLGNLQSLGEGLNELAEALGLDGIDLSGLTNARNALKEFENTSDAAAAAAQRRMVAEVAAAGERMNAIKEEGRTEREEIAQADRVRERSMRERDLNFRRERGQRQRLMRGAVNTIMGRPQEEGQGAQVTGPVAASQPSDAQKKYEQELTATLAYNQAHKAYIDQQRRQIEAANDNLRAQGLGAMPLPQYSYMELPEAPTEMPRSLVGGGQSPFQVAQRAGTAGPPAPAAGGGQATGPGQAQGEQKFMFQLGPGANNFWADLFKHLNVQMADQGVSGMEVE